MSDPARIVVVGGGISGLAAAFSVLVDADRAVHVTLLESDERTGGRIRTSPFGGLDAVDEASDSFLMRAPWATRLAADLGLADSLTSPTGAHASVWHGRLHDIPGDLMLGVPAKVRSFVRTGLISPRGKVRAALEPFLPRTADHDSIGRYVRRRFGNEIHERLVDPLVGSIYAADTDAFSMAAVPQIAALTGERSMLVAAGKARAAAAKMPAGPIFGVPVNGMGALTDALAARITALGGAIRTSTPVASIERSGRAYRVHSSDQTFDADGVIVASPARHSAGFIATLDRHAGELLSDWSHSSVVMITMLIPAAQWPRHLTGSGYLVPKPDQRWVTAASFGSNKWAHWRPGDGSMILRVSMGRDGLDVLHFDDDALVNLAIADLKRHLGKDFVPTQVRVSRWPESFPQYRPGHFTRLEEIEHHLAGSAPGVVFAGASYRGIGVPSCVQQSKKAAESILSHVGRLAQ